MEASWRASDLRVTAPSDERVQLNTAGQVELKLIAAILERPVIEKILSHLGLAPQPPPKGRVREAGLHFAA